MRAIILGSSSGGNAILFEGASDMVLVDAGLSPRVIRKLAKLVKVDLNKLRGVVVTHAHKDHSQFAGACASTFHVPVYVTEGGRRGIRLPEEARTRIISNRSPIQIGEILVHPIPVPHDAPQVALVLCSDGHRVGMVTDLGTVRPDLVEHFRGAGTLLVESNYDDAMLTHGPYSPRLQERVRVPQGASFQSANRSLLRELGSGLATVVLLHLSEKNNDPDLAETAARAALPDRVELRVAPPRGPLVVDVAPSRVQTQLAFGY